MIAERDELPEGWTDHWCGTPPLSIQQEYEERIKGIKERVNALRQRTTSGAVSI